MRALHAATLAPGRRSLNDPERAGNAPRAMFEAARAPLGTGPRSAWVARPAAMRHALTLRASAPIVGQLPGEV